ncbi:MAG: arginase family protein [Armatimonadetes bacterium]|nr:arginase family protein [Armatimonadota bacterium]
MEGPGKPGFTGFMGVPGATDLSSLEADVAFVGVPYGVPYRMGQAWSFEAPRYLREKSARFSRANGPHINYDFGIVPVDWRRLRVVDCGDVPGDPRDIPGTVARATEVIRTLLRRGILPIVLGGDDSIPIPVVRAYQDHGPLVVIQIDQHLDFKDQIQGVREGLSSPMRRISEMAWVDRIYQIGLSGYIQADPPDVEEARAAGNVLISEREVHEEGIEAVLARIPDGARYFITLDVDGLDPSIMPACTHPEPGGLTFHEAVDLFRGLARKGRVVGMDLAEFTPAHDLSGLGAHTAGRLIISLIDAMVLQGHLPQGGSGRSLA